MLDYTTAAFHKIKSDFLKVLYVFNVSTQGLYIAYLAYVLFSGKGNVWVNASLLLLSAAYYVFFLVMSGKESKGAKTTKKIVAVIYRRSKQLIKLYTLIVTVYSICITTTNATPIAVLLTAFMLVGFILQIVLEIVYSIVVSRLNLLVEGLKADVEPIVKPVKSVDSFLKKMKGEEVAPVKEKSKARLWLDKKVGENRAERAERKLALQKEKRQAKIQAKIDKLNAKKDK